MRYNLTVFLLLLFASSGVAQVGAVKFRSSDSLLQLAFDRAKAMALRYQGKPEDPVGPWYESALPPREAFCMRDVSHQAIAAEALGMRRENKNMMGLFATNISEAKDWCSYWEINKQGKPAPEDYRDDKAFWYNLVANFDLMHAAWRLYQWTGDRGYISAPDYLHFYDKTANEFIKTWVLQPDSLLTRPSHPREKPDYDKKDAFHEYRGLPSYSESVPHVKMGVDMVAVLYRGLLTYANILRINGRYAEADTFEMQALQYQKKIDTDWWDDTAKLYHTHYTDSHTFGKGEGETFLLWFGALKDPVRRELTIRHLLSKDWNVENQSYFPYQFYRYGFPRDAYHSVLHLTDPATDRREYPEVSFGVLHAFVQGLMGIEPDAKTKTISTLYRGHDESMVEISYLPVFNSIIRVRHDGSRGSVFKNNSNTVLAWKVGFRGNYAFLKIGKRAIKTTIERDEAGREISYVKVNIKPGQELTAYRM